MKNLIIFSRCLWENKYLFYSFLTALFSGTMIFLGFINVFFILAITYSYVVAVWFTFGFRSFFACKKMFENKQSSNDPLTYDEKIAEVVYNIYHNNS